ncbi:MAG: Fic family protein [Clostridia bacterium]|nr:Fic family protein [Clostridia bacterium]
MEEKCQKKDYFMKYLPYELNKAYNYDLKNCPDFQEISKPLINVSDVLKAHYILADYFTDPTAGVEVEKMLVGVRSFDLLTSAVCRQTCSYAGKTKYTDPIDICSTLFFGLVKDHAFHDGNKRTALLTLLNQLYSYGYYPKSQIYDFEKLVLAVAENSLETKYNKVWKKFKSFDDQNIKTISYIIRRLVEQKNRSYHTDITMKEFIQVLEKQGVQCEYSGLKIRMRRKTKQIIFPKTYTYTVNFYGDTRVVEAKMARDTLDALHLSNEFPSYQSFFEGRDPLYKLIAEFEEPLRRLKDE